jgi:hypothetical protein
MPIPSIDEPEASLQGAIEQLLLVEHHGCDPKRQCRACMTKHLLTAKALLEEAYALSGHATRYHACLELIRPAFRCGDKLVDIAGCARAARRAIMKKMKLEDWRV